MSNDDESLLEEGEEVVEGERELLRDMAKGLAAGFVGIVPIAILLLLKNMLGLLPDADLVGALGGIASATWAGTGWLILIGGGTLVGIGFAALDSHVEHATGTGEIARGAIFGFLLSVLLILILMGLNAGAVDMDLALVAVVAYVVYGMVMGAVYSAMKPETVAT